MVGADDGDFRARLFLGDDGVGEILHLAEAHLDAGQIALRLCEQSLHFALRTAALRCRWS